MKRTMGHRATRAVALSALAIGLTVAGAAASNDVERSTGATVYVPVYSQVYHGPKVRPFQLAATTSVRNTDPDHPIKLVSVDYYDFNGKKVRGYVTSEIELGPLASREFQVREDDRTGGSGANFIVIWRSEAPVNVPIIVGLLIGTAAGQGISFTSRGQVIK